MHDSPDNDHQSEQFRAFVAFAERRDPSGVASLSQWLALAEAWRISMALRAARGNRSAAARELGIGRRTLYAKMEKLGIRATWTV